jgi:hypothetical protein
MATVSSENQPRQANWKIAGKDREASVWQVALLSMGLHPSKATEELVKADETLAESFQARCEFLGKRLREEPCDGYVHWLIHHPYNKRAKPTRLAMVDVVSCIDLMVEDKRFELAEEFVHLQESLEKKVLYVPGRPTPDLIIMGSNSKTSDVGKSQEPRDTSKSAEKRQSDQRALQLLAIAIDAYGLKPNPSATDLEKVVAQVVEGIAVKGFIGNGLGVDAFKKSFRVGLEQVREKGLRLSE